MIMIMESELSMAYWLLKTEPDSYSFADLQRDKKTVWDGVTNNLALKNLRQIKKGDQALIYHTGDQRCIAGIAAVTRDAYPDPKQSDAKLAVVDLIPEKSFVYQVTLAQIKADGSFAGWDLLRLGRLSVMPVAPDHWQRILQLSAGKH